jgi:NitT/TauT family transport system substrate-binding protein
MTRRLISLLVFSAILALGLVTVACGSDDEGADATGGAGTVDLTSTGPAELTSPVTLRLGYFPNITHAQPLVGLERGTYAEELGPKVTLETKTFNAGPAAIEALFAGAIDATYIGPNPTINGYVQSGGKELRIIAGATSAGALLVTRAAANINTPADFANKKVATPQLGNTQDVALRAWLQANGLKDKDHGGNVQVVPSANADTLTLFQRGDIDAAWVPEPWATRLVQEAGGKVFLNESTLWPNGDFVTTQLIVRTKFLNEHPEVVERLLLAHVKTTQWINANPEEAKKLVNQGIKKATNAALPDAVINGAWPNQKVTYDPIASSLRKSADDAFALGYLQSKPDLANIYSLDLLNKVLKNLGLKAVSQ